MKIKKRYVIIIILVIVIGFISYSFLSSRKMLSIGNKKIAKVEITNGSNGYITTITDSEQLSECTEFFKNVSVKKVIKPSASGFAYSYRFYTEDNEEVYIIVTGNYCSIGLGTYEFVNTSYDEINNYTEELISKSGNTTEG